MTQRTPLRSTTRSHTSSVLVRSPLSIKNDKKPKVTELIKKRFKHFPSLLSMAIDRGLPFLITTLHNLFKDSPTIKLPTLVKAEQTFPGVVRLRDGSIHKGFTSRVIDLNTIDPPKYIHPASGEVSCPFRYTEDRQLLNDGSDIEKMYRIVIEDANFIGPIQNRVTQQLVDATPLKKKIISQQGHLTAVYRAENGSDYEVANTLKVWTAANKEIHIHQLRSCTSLDYSPLPRRHTQTTTKSTMVSLTYHNLMHPRFNHPVNNNRVHGGINAYNTLRATLEDVLEGMVQEEIISETDKQALLHQYATRYSQNNNSIEYTHGIAAHWGIVKDINGMDVDPADKDSTFQAPAAFNTEMLLFERLADYLLFINHHKWGLKTKEPSVIYQCDVTYDTNTHAPIKVYMRIQDRVSNFIFEQTFNNLFSHTQKPSAQLFRNCIKVAKDLVRGRLEIKNIPLMSNEATAQPVLTSYTNAQDDTASETATNTASDTASETDSETSSHTIAPQPAPPPAPTHRHTQAHSPAPGHAPAHKRKITF